MLKIVLFLRYFKLVDLFDNEVIKQVYYTDSSIPRQPFKNVQPVPA